MEQYTESTENTENNQFVVFSLASEEYGIDIHSVTTIEKVIPVARVPKMPQFLRGVINLRGDIIPVIDVRTRLGLEATEDTDDTRIIIVKVNELFVGVVVDAVDEVLELENSTIGDASFITSDTVKSFFFGIGRVQDRVITLLNVKSIVNIASDV